MSKKALVVVSFGTSFDVAMPAIENIEAICKKAYPDYDFFRAFTSGMIIRKLKRTKDITILNPDEVMQKLVEEGYEEVLCQPTHIINGVENDKMINMLSKYKEEIPVIRIGSPLLTEESDYATSCEIVMNELDHSLESNEAFVLMGHGTEHYANSAYCQFENMLRDMGHENTYVGTVEGFPSLDYVIGRLRRRNIEKVTIMPLMIVAGDHARNDLAGAEADSWDSILKAEGFKTSVILKGLGEIDAIGDLFVKHLEEAKQI
ncbi:MAG: sirohydrochlorin cobaltochelatase [Eubacteriales bacterium]|nr:sirohydrochlorin cobaltochelatase [Eubacteriales bacterium]